MKKTLIVLLALALLASLTSCDNETKKPYYPASVKFVKNMMGSASETETKAGNFATESAMSTDSYIDETGAIHGTFTPIQDSEFTAFWGTNSRTEKSYYARYDLNIDPLTATDEGSVGTYLFYIKKTTSGGIEKKEYGTSKSRAKCTVLGTSGEDAKKLKLEYYVIEGEYHRVVNTEYTGELPETYKNLLHGKTPVVTITVAADCTFK